MKRFLIALAVLGAMALGWNYWVMRRAAVSPSAGAPGTAFRPAPGRGGVRMPPGPATSLSGFVRVAGGLTHSAHVELVRMGPAGPARAVASDEALGDGRFSFPRVTADHYWVVAQSEIYADPMHPGQGPVRHSYGAAEFVSDGLHPGHVGVELFAGSALSGRVQLAPVTASATRELESLSIALMPADAPTRAAAAGVLASSSVTTDGRFAMDDLPGGRYELSVSDSGWTLDAVSVANHDRLERPFQLGADEHLSATVSLTEHANQLVGTLRDGAGRARPFELVAVFPADAGQRDARRRVQLVRTGTNGAFQFDGLPSGGYLLAPASGFDPPAWRTEEFFARLTPGATHVSLRGGLRAVRDLVTNAPR